MTLKVHSGGQTGIDLAAWLAAEAVGFPTGGWMPAGFRAEDGDHPEFAACFGAVENKSRDYPPRTRMNCFGSDGTIVLSVEPMTRGTGLTLKILDELKPPRPYFNACVGRVAGCRFTPASDFHPKGPEIVADWIVTEGVRTLNVAGPAESSAAGIQGWAVGYLRRVFEAVKRLQSQKEQP